MSYSVSIDISQIRRISTILLSILTLDLIKKEWNKCQVTMFIRNTHRPISSTTKNQINGLKNSKNKIWKILKN